MRNGTCLRVICTCLSEGAGAVGAGGGGRESLELLDIVVDGGATIGFCETSSGCGMGLDRGFGDWILVMTWACTGGAGSSSSGSDSDDEDDDDDVESPSSKNSKTLGTFLAGSAALSRGTLGAARALMAFVDALTSSVGDDGLLVSLGVCPGPAWVTVVTLETVDEVLFLLSFLGFLESRLWDPVCSGMMIGEGREQYPVHHFDPKKQIKEYRTQCQLGHAHSRRI